METREDSLKRMIRDLEVELEELRADLAEEQARKAPIDLSRMPEGAILSWLEKSPVMRVYAIRLSGAGAGWRIVNDENLVRTIQRSDQGLSKYLREQGITEVRISHADRWSKIDGSTDREEIHAAVCDSCE